MREEIVDDAESAEPVRVTTVVENGVVCMEHVSDQVRLYVNYSAEGARKMAANLIEAAAELEGADG